MKLRFFRALHFVLGYISKDDYYSVGNIPHMHIMVDIR